MDFFTEKIKQLTSLNAFKNYMKSWCDQIATYVRHLLNKHLTSSISKINFKEK